ncbi:hypothetical protein BT96DRAFT_925115 [Gymnopus androsaceus JB14]|uniref:Uncharacterized protein n=1 Tax=Gymnopus androsaceus JB14 TaxID=1447944 RepID=A0A6A4H120_9AGAR|nr:hypothetical protein BT96DRAFT_925115 [Gymnopus androsaceus JB14]
MIMERNFGVVDVVTLPVAGGPKYITFQELCQAKTTSSSPILSPRSNLYYPSLTSRDEVVLVVAQNVDVTVNVYQVDRVTASELMVQNLRPSFLRSGGM